MRQSNIIVGGAEANLLIGLWRAMTASAAATDDDTLLGGDGNDTLGGQFDHDLLIGGAGKDRFVVNRTIVSADVIGDLEVSHLGGDIVDLNGRCCPIAFPGGSPMSDYIRVVGGERLDADRDRCRRHRRRRDFQGGRDAAQASSPTAAA